LQLKQQQRFRKTAAVWPRLRVTTISNILCSFGHFVRKSNPSKSILKGGDTAARTLELKGNLLKQAAYWTTKVWWKTVLHDIEIKSQRKQNGPM